VAQVNIVGGDSAQLNVNVRPGDLAAAGVGIDQVVGAVPKAVLQQRIERANG